MKISMSQIGQSATYYHNGSTWLRIAKTKVVTQNNNYGDVGFHGTPPVAQQPSSGAATAGGTWSSTEQAMLQEAYDALRAYGLLS